MDPIPHNSVLPQFLRSGLNSLALQVFRLLIHSIRNSKICLYSSSEKDKQPVAKKWNIGREEVQYQGFQE